MKLSRLLLGSALVIGVPALAQIAVGQEWKSVADGVLVHEDPDGTTTRMAFGEAGIRYDRTWIGERIAKLTSLVAQGGATDGDIAELASLREALRGLADTGSVKSAAEPVPAISTSGYLCASYFTYAFDSHLVAGPVGATAVARVLFDIPAFGPPPAVTSIAQYDRAVVTPRGGSAITSTHSLNSSLINPSAIADWHYNPLGSGTFAGSSSCTASTYAYVQVTAPVCTGGVGFVSQTKSYPTCVSAP